MLTSGADVVELTQSLVRVDTANPPGNELAAAKVLRDWLHDHGVEAEIDEFEPGRANLIATIKGPEPGPSLMLNTHMDVVPPGSGWTHGAFSATVQDGRLFGRGAVDSKGSLAAMAAALVNMHRRGLLQRGSITLAAVADEEVGSAGARHLLQTMRPDMAIVGEPTSLRLAIAHKGSVRPIVTVTGRSAHAAQPEEGVNAVEAAADLLVFLRRYAAGLRERAHPLVGPPTFAVVKIEGGVALNAVPASCTITFDRRMVPGETNDSVLAEFEEALEQFNRERGEGHATLAGLGPSTGGPSETAPDHPFVRAAAQALSAIGQSGQPIGLMFNCDMTHFSAAGIPTVVYGPGEIARMHTVDESVALDDLRAAVDGYTAMALAALEKGAP